MWQSYSELTAFQDIHQCFQLKGKKVSSSPISEVIYWEHDGEGYYVKRYFRRGKYLRSLLGRSRIRAEWENLLLFRKLGIPIPKIIAFGEERSIRKGSYQGALVTKAIPNANDLARLAQRRDPLFDQVGQKKNVIDQVAYYTKRLHQCQFVHTDLKWRNILVETLEEAPKVIFFDCPQGRRLPSWLSHRGKIKDVACLYKLGKTHLTQKDQIRFLHQYFSTQKLNMRQRDFTKRAKEFFEGRE